MSNFIDDLEKMTDLLEALIDNKLQNTDEYTERFLQSYSYLTKDELKETINLINGETLADLFRQAENYYIDELNGRETGLAISSETAKTMISNYVFLSSKFDLLPIEEVENFKECCEAMAC